MPLKRRKPISRGTKPLRRRRAPRAPAPAKARPEFPAELAQAYALLELEPGAGRESVRAAYRSLVARFHPDKSAGLRPGLRLAAEQQMREIVCAYEQLVAYLEGG